MARILVVDDDDDVRASLVRVVEGAGHVTEQASDGRQAWELQSARPFDLVLTDLFMPEADGIELLTRLSESDPGTLVIAISGGGRIVGNLDALSDAEAFGASATLSKPFTPAELLDTIRQVLGED